LIPPIIKKRAFSNLVLTRKEYPRKQDVKIPKQDRTAKFRQSLLYLGVQAGEKVEEAKLDSGIAKTQILL
jgi:hypothetical protein